MSSDPESAPSGDMQVAQVAQDTKDPAAPQNHSQLNIPSPGTPPGTKPALSSSLPQPGQTAAASLLNVGPLGAQINSIQNLMAHQQLSMAQRGQMNTWAMQAQVRGAGTGARGRGCKIGHSTLARFRADCAPLPIKLSKKCATSLRPAPSLSLSLPFSPQTSNLDTFTSTFPEYQQQYQHQHR